MRRETRAGPRPRVSLRARLGLTFGGALVVGAALGAVVWTIFSADPWAVAMALLAVFALVLGVAWAVIDGAVRRLTGYLRDLGSASSVAPTGKPPPEIAEIAAAMTAMTQRIAERDRALEDGLMEKDGLLREIHHRVKNNLQVISSFLNLQQRTLSDPAAQAALEDARQRIAALALIYRALYEGPDLRKVDLGVFLEELIAQLVAGDGGSRPNIRTELAIDDLTMDPDHLAPLALFAVEAIANARKHGLAEAGGRLKVAFHAQNATAELAITDGGCPGKPPAVVGEGVGKTLMLAFARQLGGEVSFCPAPDGGLTVRLVFPTPAPGR